MFLNSQRSSYQRKVYVLSYQLEDYTKEDLAKDLEDQLKDVKVLLIAQYSLKINPTIPNPGNKSKYLVYLELSKKRQLSKEETFEVQGVKPFLEEYTRNKALTKIQEKDSNHFQKGLDLNSKLKSVKDKKNSVYAENIHKLKNGKITCKQIRDKNPVDWSNNKRKYREFEAEEHAIRKKRRIEEDIMPPSKFKYIPMELVKGNYIEEEILKFYNFRLVEQRFNKKASGLYLWSRPVSIGKSTLLKLLQLIDPNIYFWDSDDRGWQSKWDKTKDYSMIAFDAINCGKDVPFRIYERFGDKANVTMNQKYEADPDYISSKTPSITTSNGPPEEIWPGKKIHVFKERIITLELKEPIFHLIDLIAEYNGVNKIEPNDPYILKDELVKSKSVVRDDTPVYFTHIWELGDDDDWE